MHIVICGLNWKPVKQKNIKHSNLLSNTLCDERLLQTKIDWVVAELETWFNRNDLLINAGKTAVMLCHNRQTHVLVKPLVNFNNMNVDYTAEIKFLGIHRCTKMSLSCTVTGR